MKESEVVQFIITPRFSIGFERNRETRELTPPSNEIPRCQLWDRHCGDLGAIRITATPTPS